MPAIILKAWRAAQVAMNAVLRDVGLLMAQEPSYQCCSVLMLSCLSNLQNDSRNCVLTAL